MAKRNTQVTTDVLPLVAIEMGSDSIRAMAAERINNDMLRILGYEESRKHHCVDRGVVVQSSDAGFMISEVLKKLANRINRENLPTAFVLLGGRSMQVVAVGCKRDLIHKRAIPATILQEMEAECCEKIEFKHPEAAVLAIVPSYYCLDGQEQEERPRPDQRAAQFEAHYIAFVGKKELKEKIQDSFDRSGKSIEQTFARPEALLSSFIPDNPDVLYDGCAVLDFGAETTTLSIFKGTEYLYTKVVALKTQYGFASPDLVSDKDNLRMRIPLATGEAMNFTTREVAQLIQQKLDEILTPLLAGLSTFESRISVLYITGGGSLLQGMDSYLQSKTGVKVLYGSHALLLAPDTDDEFYNPRYSSLVGALILGSDYREAHPGQKIPPAKITDAVGDMLLKFFTDTETSTPTK